MDPEPNHLFVYGTLRRKADNRLSRLLARSAEFVGRARIQGRLYDLGKYPGLVPSTSPADWVRGELFRLRQPEALLAALDAYEGFDPRRPDRSPFVRRTAGVVSSRQENIPAWVYWYQGAVSERLRIEGGDYRPGEPQ